MTNSCKTQGETKFWPHRSCHPEGQEVTFTIDSQDNGIEITSSGVLSFVTAPTGLTAEEGNDTEVYTATVTATDANSNSSK